MYQVPVVARATSSVDAAAAHVIGNPEPGTTLIDGPFDPAYAAALLRMAAHGGEGRGSRTLARGVPSPAAPPIVAERRRVRRGDRRAVEHEHHLPTRRTRRTCR